MKRIIFSLVTIGFYGFFAFLGSLYAYGAKKYEAGLEQPIAFSHKIHAGQQKMECTFCHEYAGTSKHAGIPSVQKCMTCHETIRTDSPEVQKLHRYAKGEMVEFKSDAVKQLESGVVPKDMENVLPTNAMVKQEKADQWLIVDLNNKEHTYKDNWRENRKFLVTKESEDKGSATLKYREEHGVPWARIHWLPDHVYFSHKRHIKAGVNCTECHIRMEWMDKVRKVPSMKMGWCLECHNTRQAPRDCYTCHK